MVAFRSTMYTEYIIFIFFLKITLSYTACEKEQYMDENGKTCTWEAADDDEFVAPSPLCLTKSGKLNIRKCVNGEWILSGDGISGCEVVDDEYSYELGTLTFYKLSKDPEPFNVQNIRIANSEFIFYGSEDIWLPCRNEHPELRFFPFTCTFAEEFNVNIEQDLESDSSNTCVMRNGNNMYIAESCEDKFYIADLNVNLNYNSRCLEESYSLSYEQQICYGKNFDEKLSMKSFAPLYNIFKIHMFTYNFFDDVRLYQSTTFPNVDAFLDKDNGDGLILKEVIEDSGPILSLYNIPKKNVKFTLSNSNNGAYIELKVQNFDYLWRLKGYGITCLTAGVENYISKAYDFEKFNEIDNTHFFRIFFGKDPGFTYYWCVGRTIFGLETVESERILAGYLPESSDQYVFEVSWKILSFEDTRNMLVNEFNTIGLNYKSIFIFEIHELNADISKILCHVVCSENIETVQEKLHEAFADSFHGTVNSTTVCYSTPLNSSILDTVWMTTKINEIGYLNSSKYLTDDYEIPTRKCVGEFKYGAMWEAYTEELIYNVTAGLEDILENISEQTVLETITLLDDIISKGKDELRRHDYESIEKILQEIDVDEVEPGDEEEVIGNVTSLCNNLLESEPCRNCRNTTNNIALSVETIIDSLIIRPDVQVSEDDGTCKFLETSFQVIGIDVTIANMTGLLFYETYYIPIFKNTTSEELVQIVMSQKPLFGTYIPSNLLDFWNLQNDSKVVIKMYRNDNLFQDRDYRQMQRTESEIISISVPNYPSDDLRGYEIPLIMEYKSMNPVCFYWNFRRQSWKENGISTQEFPEQNIVFCNLSHMTPFTHLIDVWKGPFEDIFWLDFITMVFSTLSFIGIVGIFFTASILRKWRKTNSTKILLQLTLASFLQILLFFTISAFDYEENFVVCFVLGILLQYTLLVEFLWMMVIAISNWMFYKYPFRHGPLRLLHLTILCWATPILPVSFSIGFSLMESFKDQFDYNICFPHTSVKLWCFVIPLFAIMAVNIVFYGLLLYEFTLIWKNEDVLVNLKSNRLKPILRNTTVFFFALGLPWIFGVFHILLSASYYPNVFSYIFVLTAPLQGFILFIYFVLINPSVHEEWQNMVDCTRTKGENEWNRKDKAINFWVRCWTCKEE